MKKDNHSFTIRLSDGRTLGYALYGDPLGKPVFYFHGWPDSRLRISLIDTIARKENIRLISIDRPGYGLSDYKEKRTILDWPDDVLELADNLKITKFSVVGVSGGGPYAAVCAYKIPQRLHNASIVVGLGPTYIPGILAGMPFFPRLGWANYSKFPILALLGSLYRKWGEKYFYGILSLFDFRSPSDQQVLHGIKEDWHTLSLEAFRQGHKGAQKDLLLYTSNWGFDVSNIKANVYLWYGEQDKNVTLAMARYYESHIKHSKLTIYPNEGHLISVTHAREILTTAAHT